MSQKLRIAAICLAAAGWIAPAAAQAVYRCGNSYSQQPCAGGSPVETQDARSASQRAQTTQAAQRDAKAASAMEKDRLKNEAKPAQAYIPAPKEPELAPEDGNLAQPAKARKPALFTAVSPRKPGDTHAKKKKKAKKKKTD
jgi:hypothetical protein